MDDHRSTVAWSEASIADQMMFTVLGNADRLDMGAVPRAREQDVTPRIEEIDERGPTIDMPTTRSRIDEETAPARFENLTTLPDELRPLSYEETGRVEPLQSERLGPVPREPTPPLPRSDEIPTYPPPEERAPEVRTPPDEKPSENDQQSLPPPPPPPEPSGFANMADETAQLRANLGSSNDEDAKRTVLLDLQTLKMQGVRLTRDWTMDDSIDDMTLELRRHVLAMDEKNNVNMMRDGLKMMATGVEMVSTRFGILDLEGWSTELCSDMNKHDPNLARIYRKYWKRGVSNNPERDLAFAIFGSMGMHHLKRTMSKQLMSRNGPKAPSSAKPGAFASAFSRRRGNAPKRPETPPSSDDEGLPP